MSPSDGAAFDADYFDGRSAARRRVTVSRSPSGVTIRGDGVALEVPLAALRFRARVGDLPLRIELPANGVLVADAGMVSQVLTLPAATGLAQRLESNTRMLVASIAGVIVATVLGWFYGLPWLAERASHLVPAEMEQELAVEGLKGLDRFVLRPSDLPGARREELLRTFDAMAGKSGTRAKLLFRHGEWLGPNAFALPGANIVVTDELVQLMGDDDLVMAVLAHELGHVEHRHVTRQLLQSSAVALGSVLLLGDLTAVSGLAAALPAALLHNRYSRDLEREADRYAFDLLVRTGRSPRHFAQALGKLEEAVAAKGRSDVPTFISTHPATKERIRAARDAAP
jgi:Zn-dependent protease with chaperone function